MLLSILFKCLLLPYQLESAIFELDATDADESTLSAIDICEFIESSFLAFLTNLRFGGDGVEVVGKLFIGLVIVGTSESEDVPILFSFGSGSSNL
jgi:hypothetical protein